MWFDTHCHLGYLEDQIGEAVQQANNSMVSHLVTIGCSIKDWQTNISVAEQNKNVWASAGVHPHEAKDGISNLEEILKDKNIIAVGECGLDYHYDHSPRDAQKEVFASQIELAKKTNKTLIIHTRNAWDDTFSILDEQGIPEKTVFHCFSGGVDEAKKCLDRDAYISFSGIVTFPSAAGDVQEAAKMVPADRIVVETDTPYLAPVPLRGQKNVPANVAVVGEFVASLREADVTAFAAQTMQNSKELFNLPV